MQISKEVLVHLDVREIVENVDKEESRELILPILRKELNAQQSQLRDHKKYLKEQTEANDRPDLIEFQKNCVASLKLLISLLEQIITLLESASKPLTDYSRARGYKGVNFGYDYQQKKDCKQFTGSYNNKCKHSSGKQYSMCPVDCEHYEVK